MSKQQMNRTELGEVKRQLNFGITHYLRRQEKFESSQAAYKAKIEALQTKYEAMLREEGSK